MDEHEYYDPHLTTGKKVNHTLEDILLFEFVLVCFYFFVVGLFSLQYNLVVNLEGLFTQQNTSIGYCHLHLRGLEEEGSSRQG